MEPVYLVRYGRQGHLGRFRAREDGYARGATVVVRTARGTELGEVLAPSAFGGGAEAGEILRSAGSDDLARAARAERDRAGALERCEELFRDGVWPLVLIDVEPLLDERRLVISYLGPHRLDGGLIEALRERFGWDAWLDPVGRDEPEAEPDAASDEGGCGDCGSGGGCGSGGCGTESGGCSGCSVKDLVHRRPARAS